MPQNQPVSPRKQTLGDLVPTIMVLCCGRLADEAPFWAYVALRPQDTPAFYEARTRGALNLENYGTVIHWGQGGEPPEDVKEQMREQYGMQEDFEEKLRAALALHNS